MKASLLCLLLLLTPLAQGFVEEDSPLDVEPTVTKPAVKPKAAVETPQPKPITFHDEAPSKPVSTTVETPAPKKIKANEEANKVVKPKAANDTSTAKPKTAIETTTNKAKTTSTTNSAAKEKPKTAITDSTVTKAKAKPTTDTPKKSATTTEATTTEATVAKKKTTTVKEPSTQKKTNSTPDTTARNTNPVNTPPVTSKPTVTPTAALASSIAVASVSAATIANPISSPTVEQRQQLLVNNAEKIDQMNRELLTQNQSLQLANEKLTIQVELLQHDRSSEYMRDGALAIIIGLFLGWAISSNKRRHSKWS